MTVFRFAFNIMTRGISTRSNLEYTQTAATLDDCGNIVEHGKTRKNIRVTDLPVFIQVCGLGDKVLCLQKEWLGCGCKVIRTTPVVDTCGCPVKLSENCPQALLIMPGCYFLTVEGDEVEEFPEDFLCEAKGIDFLWAKCWLEAHG